MKMQKQNQQGGIKRVVNIAMLFLAEKGIRSGRNCFAGEEMVVLPPLLHPHLRDGGLRGPRPPVIIFILLLIQSYNHIL